MGARWALACADRRLYGPGREHSHHQLTVHKRACLPPAEAGLKLARGFGLAKPKSFLQQHGGKLAVGGVLVAGVVALKALKAI
jgi:hypothetical protein